MHCWFLGFGDFESSTDFIKSQGPSMQHSMAGFKVVGVFSILQTSSSHRGHYWSTAWLFFFGGGGVSGLLGFTDFIKSTTALHGWFFSFWGFEGFTDFIKSQTVLLEHCMGTKLQALKQLTISYDWDKLQRWDFTYCTHHLLPDPCCLNNEIIIKYFISTTSWISTCNFCHAYYTYTKQGFWYSLWTGESGA